MLDAEKRAELDQALAEVKEAWPAMFWGLYKGYQEQGFSEPQSFELVKTHILALGRAQ